MKKVILEGTKMMTIQDVHEELIRKLSLPSYYGKNLDALWDFVSTVQEDHDVYLIDSIPMLNALMSYGADLLHVFFDAVTENMHMSFTLAEKDEIE